jgi:hypothetical protein
MATVPDLSASSATVDATLAGYDETPISGTSAGTTINVNGLEAVQISTSATGVRLTATGTATNIPFALTPKGTGAVAAHLADSALTGGNTRGTNAVDWQTVRTSAGQVASGTRAVIGGGISNVGGGNNSVVGGGDSNTVNGGAAVVAGGAGNAANGTYGWCPGGLQATTRSIIGRGSWASGQLAVLGDAQAGELVLRKQTTDATVTTLTSDNNAAGTTNQNILPNNSAACVRVQLVGRSSDHTTFAVWDLFYMLSRGAAAANTVVTAIASYATGLAPTYSVGTMSGALAIVVADTTNGGASIRVAGIAATNISWVARVLIVEVAA